MGPCFNRKSSFEQQMLIVSKLITKKKKRLGQSSDSLHHCWLDSYVAINWNMICGSLVENVIKTNKSNLDILMSD